MTQKGTYDLTKEADEFQKSKDNYVERRFNQREIIVEFLERTLNGEKDFKIEKSQGSPNYKGGIPKGGLINWKWIELWKNGMYYFISLQPFDQEIIT